MYDEAPIFIPVNITKDVVKSFACKHPGSYGPGGTDSKGLQELILNLGRTEKKFVLVLKFLFTGSPIRIHPTQHTGR